MASSQTPAMFSRFSTLTQPRELRLHYWNEVIGRVYQGMTVAADRDIAASWSQCWLGKVRLADVCSQRALVDRRDVGSTVSGPRSERFHCLIPKRGHFLISQRQRSASVALGDLTVLFGGEPYQIAVSEGNESFVIDCPAGSLPTAPYHAVAQCIDGSVPAVRMLCSFLRSLLHQDWPDAPEQPDLEVLGDVLLKLVARCLHLRSPHPTECVGATRERVTSFVMKHLANSDLRTAMIAESLSLCPRSVQNVFATMATTPTAFILSKRLALAADILKSGDDFGSITDLAFELGFNDSAYFARRFKKRFGMSPSRYRRLKHN